MPTEIRIYTDGSSIKGGDGARYAGVGIWFGMDDDRNSSIPILSEGVTNQLAELTAIYHALKYAKDIATLYIYTDSWYGMKCVTEWYVNWEANGWKNSRHQPVAHSDVIRNCRKIMSYRDMHSLATHFIHVRAHTGILGNECADRLASDASTLARDILGRRMDG
jgi:ribonuclease HI